jgi:hypothetical protein
MGILTQWLRILGSRNNVLQNPFPIYWMQRADKPATMKLGSDNKKAKQVTRCQRTVARNTGWNGTIELIHSWWDESNHQAKYHKLLNTLDGSNKGNSEGNALPATEKQ